MSQSDNEFNSSDSRLLSNVGVQTQRQTRHSSKESGSQPEHTMLPYVSPKKKHARSQSVVTVVNSQTNQQGNPQPEAPPDTPSDNEEPQPRLTAYKDFSPEYTARQSSLIRGPTLPPTHGSLKGHKIRQADFQPIQSSQALVSGYELRPREPQSNQSSRSRGLRHEFQLPDSQPNPQPYPYGYRHEPRPDNLQPRDSLIRSFKGAALFMEELQLSDPDAYKRAMDRTKRQQQAEQPEPISRSYTHSPAYNQAYSQESSR